MNVVVSPSTETGPRTGAPHGANSTPGVLHRLSVAVVLLSCAAASLAFCVVAVRAIGFFGPTTRAEGNQIDAIMRLRAGQPLYLDFSELPFLVTPYPPLMYVADALISSMLGLDFFGTTVAARIVSLAATFASVALVYGLARSRGADRLAAVAGAALVLPMPFIDGWAFTTRADAVAIMLSLLAGFVLVHRPQQPYLAAVVSVAAFFAKQTMVALPPAACLWLWLDGRRRAAIVFAVTWFVLAAATFGLLQLQSGGTYGLNTITAHLNPTNGFDTAFSFFIQLPREAWLPCALAAFALIAGLTRRERPGLVDLYWLVSLAMTFYTLRGRGADSNYFIEPTMLACALSAWTIGRVWRRSSGPSMWARVAAPALAMAVLVWSAGAIQFWREGGQYADQGPVSFPELATAERIWAEEPSLVTFQGKPLLASDPFPLSQMVEAGNLDPDGMVRAIESRQLDLIVIRGDARQPRYINGQIKWPPQVLQAVARYYVVQRTRGPYWLYVPDGGRRASR